MHGVARVLGCLLLLAACDRTATGEFIPYPSLSTVPPRPEPQYSVEDRQAIKSDLVTDLQNAIAQGDALAVRLGQRDAPAAPAEPVATAGNDETTDDAGTADTGEGQTTETAEAAPADTGVAVPFPGGGIPTAFGADSPLVAGPPESPDEVSAEGSLAEAYVRDQIKRSSDEGKLKDFLGRIARAPPRWVGPSSLAAAVGLQSDSQTSPPADGGTPTAAPAAPQEAAAQPAGIVRVVFAPGAAGLSTSADADLRRALAAAPDGRLRIVAAGADPGLGRERADAIAAALVRLGAAPTALDIATSDAVSDAAVVYPTPRAAS